MKDNPIRIKNNTIFNLQHIKKMRVTKPSGFRFSGLRGKVWADINDLIIGEIIVVKSGIDAHKLRMSLSYIKKKTLLNFKTFTDNDKLYIKRIPA